MWCTAASLTHSDRQSQAANDFGKQVLTAVPKRTKKSAPRKSGKVVHAPSLERRRSTRVAGLPAKTYDENVLLGVDAAERKGSRKVDFSGMLLDMRMGCCVGEKQTIKSDHLVGPGAVEERYTQQHVDALGDYEKEWYVVFWCGMDDASRICPSMLCIVLCCLWP